MAGRPPTPENVRALRGYPDHRRPRKNVPDLPPGAPEMPPYLSAEARKEWRRSLPTMLKYGLISAADGVSFAEICEHVAALVQVNRALRKCKNKLLTEKVTVDMDGGTHIEVKANPLMTLKMNLITKGRTLYAEFGLTPSSRCRLQVPEGFKPPKDPDQEFLDGNAATG